MTLNSVRFNRSPSAAETAKPSIRAIRREITGCVFAVLGLVIFSLFVHIGFPAAAVKPKATANKLLDVSGNRYVVSYQASERLPPRQRRRWTASLVIMRYYKFREIDFPIKHDALYVEVDDKRVFRGIMSSGEMRFGSNVKIPLLMEEQFENRAYEYQAELSKWLETADEIDAQEFEKIWSENLARKAERWLLAKLWYRVGNQVKGRIYLFCSQSFFIDDVYVILCFDKSDVI